MGRYVLVIGAAAIGMILAGALAIVLFGRLWMRAGFGAAFLVIGGGLILFAWLMDRKARKSRAGLERV
jgi:hypothetical protein